jgi:hypothetical protein
LLRVSITEGAGDWGEGEDGEMGRGGDGEKFQFITLLLEGSIPVIEKYL